MAEIKTLEDVKQSGLFGTSNFDSIINSSLEVLDSRPDLVSERGMDISDTPISPMALDDDYTPMLFSPEVMRDYKRLVEIINDPVTAKEYSFVMLGKSGSFGGEKCYLVDRIVDCSLPNLSIRVTQMD